MHGLDTEPPLRSPAPTVQTLYDVIPLLVDDPHLAAARRRWLRLAHRFRAADRVVAISRHAAETGMQQLGLDHRRVVVAPLGVNAGWSPEGPVHTEPDGVPYVLLVGEYARRKGFAEAFAVVADLARRGLPHRLVVAGRLVPWTEPTVRSLVAGSGDASRIRLAGRVDDLGALYRGADAVVVTARAEGFGLPPVEAMACGTPVVSFANTALTETVGDGGVLVPDGDVAAFAAALADVLGDDAARRDLVAAGAARVRSLTWAACADVHVAVYRELGG